ncbi:MAG: CPBP family intramembrane metalloprotease [Candidatus Aminicenantes bacterium]
MESRWGEQPTDILRVLFQRAAGVVCLGLVPGILILTLSSRRLSGLGITFSYSVSALFWTLGLGGCVLAVSYFFSRRPENFRLYPQIRKKEWTLITVLINTGSWMAYLLAYEFLFRGILLFTIDETLGVWPAVLITTFLYALVHIPKGWTETLGAVPFGVILGFVTLQTGIIWPAFFIHALLALSNDHFALSANPDMRYVFSRSKNQS